MSLSSFNPLSPIKTTFRQFDIERVILSIDQQKILALALGAFAALSAILSLAYFLYNKRKVQMLEGLKKSQENQITVPNLTEKGEEPDINQPETKEKEKPSETLVQKIEQSDPHQTIRAQNHERANASKGIESSKDSVDKPTPSNIDLTQWIFKENNIQKVVEIFNDPNQFNLRESCKEYFKRSLLTQGDHMPTVFRSIKKEQLLFDFLLEKLFEQLESASTGNVREIMIDHFKAIISDPQLTQNDLVGFLLYILLKREEKSTPKNEFKVDYFFKKVLQHLSFDELQILINSIMNQKQNSWERLQFLKEDVFHGLGFETERQLILSALYKTQDGYLLNRLHHPSYWKSLCKNISITQLNKLIQYWKENQTLSQLTGNLGLLIEDIDLKKAKEILVNLSKDNVNLIYLVHHTKCHGNKLHHYVCGAYVLQILNSSESEAIKRSKIAELTESLSVSNWPYQDGIKDRDQQFCSFLSEFCFLKYLSVLLLSFVSCENGKSLGTLLLLKTLQNPARIKVINESEIFAAYWSSWRKFETNSSPKCSQLILPEIRSEELLKVVCQSIPHDPIEKVIIVSHLIGTFKIEVTPTKSVTYKLPLKQEVFDRVMPKLELEDYLAYLTAMSIKWEKEKKLVLDDQEILRLVFTPFSDKQVEAFAEHILKEGTHPRNIFLLVKYGSRSRGEVNAILDLYLPTLQDAEILSDLWDLIDLSAKQKLPLDQLDLIIKHWHSTLKEELFLEKWLELLKARGFEKREKILVNLSSKVNLDFEKLCAKIKPYSDFG